jgi:hypothetical protein
VGRGLTTQAVLLSARWTHEADRYPRNVVIERFNQAIMLNQE